MPQLLWKRLRKRRILRHHADVALICQRLMADAAQSASDYQSSVKKDLGTSRIIWQYWAQGWDNVPDVVARCMASVNRFAGDYRVIRLSDADVEEYVEIPAFIKAKRGQMITAHFSDILRLLLLKTYGGLWLDATVLMSQPVPQDIKEADFFVYRRCPDEPHKDFWENTYAYYFGWEPGFRVRMLNSIMASQPNHPLIATCCNLLLHWWKTKDTISDYFFFQILFDEVIRDPRYVTGFPLVNDCLPHYLQQSQEPGGFPFMSRDEILRAIPFHKLTYKHEQAL